MSLELIIIIILIAYIGYLQFRLLKSNSKIEKLLIRQETNLQTFTKEQLIELISKLQGVSFDYLVKPSKLFEPEVQEFIFNDEQNQNLYIHYTKDEEVASSICREGFRFADSFYKTAEAITNDNLDFVYKHNLRKHFGKHVVVIAIDKGIFEKYSNKITKLHKVVNVEQILSITCPQLNENLDEVYQLPNQFIKGYINTDTGDITPNPQFNPKYDSPNFEQNVNSLS